MYKVKQSDFNVSSAYVLKTDMDRCSPVDAGSRNFNSPLHIFISSNAV